MPKPDVSINELRDEILERRANAPQQTGNGGRQMFTLSLVKTIIWVVGLIVGCALYINQIGATNLQLTAELSTRVGILEVQQKMVGANLEEIKRDVRELLRMHITPTSTRTGSR